MSQALVGKKSKQDNREEEPRKQKDERGSGNSVVKQTKEPVLPPNEPKRLQSQETEPSAKGARAKEIPSRENSTSANKKQTVVNATVTEVTSPGVETSPAESGLVEKQGKGTIMEVPHRNC